MADFLICKHKFIFLSRYCAYSIMVADGIDGRAMTDRYLKDKYKQKLTGTNATQDHKTPLSVFFKVRTEYQERFRL